MERGEDEVAGQRGAHGDLGRLRVAGLADQHDVGILAQDVAQAAGEGQADLRLDLDLADVVEPVLDGILDGHHVAPRGIDPVEGGIERGRLAGPGGAGDDDHAVRQAQQALEAPGLRRVQAQRRQRQAGILAVQQTQDDPLAVGHRHGRDPDVEQAVADAHLGHAVLRQAALGDVHARHHLEPRHERGLEMLGRLGAVVEHAVDAVAHGQARLEGLEMDVGGVLLDGLEQDQVDQMRDGGGPGRLEQVARARPRVPAPGGGAPGVRPGRVERADVAAGIGIGMGGVAARDRLPHDGLGGDHAAQRTADHLGRLLVHFDAGGVGHQQARLAVDAQRQDVVAARPGQRQRGHQFRHEHGVVDGRQEGQPQAFGPRARLGRRVRALAAGHRGLRHHRGFPS